MNLLYRTSCSSSTLTQLVHHPEGCLSHLPNAIKIRGRPDPPPENPERIDTLVKERMGILHSREFKINTKIVWNEMIPLVHMVDILRVHEYEYVKNIKALCTQASLLSDGTIALGK